MTFKGKRNIPAKKYILAFNSQNHVVAIFVRSARDARRCSCKWKWATEGTPNRERTVGGASSSANKTFRPRGTRSIALRSVVLRRTIYSRAHPPRFPPLGAAARAYRAAPASLDHSNPRRHATPRRPRLRVVLELIKPRDAVIGARGNPNLRACVRSRVRFAYAKPILITQLK